MSSNKFAIIAALFVACLSRSSLAQADRIYGPNDVAEAGTIIKATPVAVTMKVKGEDREFLTKDIRWITWADSPAELERARKHADGGEFKEAVDELSELDVNTVRSAIVREEIEFHNALWLYRLMLRGKGDILQAGKAMHQFTQEHPQSYHRFEAIEVVGNMLVEFGHPDRAEKFYAQLAQAPWPEYKMKSHVLVGGVQAEQGKHEQALAHYDAVIKAPESESNESVRQRLLAQLGKASCWRALRKSDDAIELIKNVYPLNVDNAMKPFADEINFRALLVLGQCHEAEGKLEAARDNFLAVHKSEKVDAYSDAEALYYLARLWKQLDEPAESRRASTILRAKYGYTKWARKLE